MNYCVFKVPLDETEKLCQLLGEIDQQNLERVGIVAHHYTRAYEVICKGTPESIEAVAQWLTGD